VVVLYEPQTQSELQTSQPIPSKNSGGDELTVNPDASVDQPRAAARRHRR